MPVFAGWRYSVRSDILIICRGDGSLRRFAPAPSEREPFGGHPVAPSLRELSPKVTEGVVTPPILPWSPSVNKSKRRRTDAISGRRLCLCSVQRVEVLFEGGADGAGAGDLLAEEGFDLVGEANFLQVHAPDIGVGEYGLEFIGQGIGVADFDV